MHSDLIELIVIQLVDLHLLNLGSWVDRRGPHGPTDSTISSAVLLKIITAMAQTCQLVRLFV